MGRPQIHPDGYWLSQEEGHVFDPALARELEHFLYGKSVCDFGCGMGHYVHWLRKCGVECDGYDGNPNTYELTLGACHTLNLAKPVDLTKRYDVVTCLEVAEHIPKQYETVFLDNLARHAKEMILLSWAVPGQLGDGHVNCRMNSYVIYRLWQRGFRLQTAETIYLRTHCSFWSPHTLMVFSKFQARRSFGELKAVGRIFLEDINRLNRSNSSLIGASIGKASRIYCNLKSKFTLVRILRYDAINLLRPRFDLGEQMLSPGSFFPVCFTCRRHFGFLRFALLSLSTRAARVKKIHVYMDKADPLTVSQRELLEMQSKYPLVFKTTLYPMSQAGLRTILNELSAFRNVARQMSMGDFLLKFDSDVVFLSDAIFQFVTNSGGDAIGTSVNGVHSQTRSGRKTDSMQGGCYFIAAAKLRTILNCSITKMALFMLREYANIFEDRFVSSLLQQCGAKIVYDGFLYYDPCLAKADLDEIELEARLRAIPAAASVLHFEGGDKSNLRRVAEKLLPDQPPLGGPSRMSV
jgi:Methyltransferase domain